MGVKVAWGVDASGVLLHISEVANGKDCDCTCPECGMPLIACNNGRIAHHFKHAAKSSFETPDCTGESALHLAAKQLLVEAARSGERFTVPNKRRYQLKRGLVKQRPDAGDFEPHSLLTLCNGKQEFPLPSGQRTDVLLDLSSGEQLAVEFRVSSRKKLSDIERFRDAGMDVLEIDLSRLRWNTDKGELLRSVLSEAPRVWLVASGIYVTPQNISLGVTQPRYTSKEDYQLQKRIERFTAVAGYRDQFDEMVNAKSIEIVNVKSTTLRWPVIASSKNVTLEGQAIRASVHKVPQLISVCDWRELSVDSQTGLAMSWLATGRINSNIEVSVLFTTDKDEEVGEDKDKEPAGDDADNVNRVLLRVAVSDFDILRFSLSWEGIDHWHNAAERHVHTQLQARINSWNALMPTKGALEVTSKNSTDDEMFQFMALHFSLSNIPDSYFRKTPQWGVSDGLWMSLIWYFILPFTDKVSASTLAMDRWLSITLGWSVHVLESGYGRRQRDIEIWLEYLSSVTEIKKEGGGWHRVNMTESAPIPWDHR